ncbi:hypothetical protein ABT56_01485 [Photobacterium aquae]|uniref:DUF3541 domain-containing protein n=1 Tax=Photobacterium aquae TaxID=1195763 RepID=A0A0J1K3B7_9GAMM|nr:DUF3541 domain-containing protein [Photobacterium aquae]KLV08907.1 hypothetical protein ABT56_01485 [Photobacterium aquae]
MIRVWKGFGTSALVASLLLSAPLLGEPLPDQSSSQAASKTALPSLAVAVTSYQQDAATIRHTYESQLFTLPAFKMGHYGLRMYRQTHDPKYHAAIWSDMARVASRLNYFATEVYTPAQIQVYSADRLSRYDHKDDIRSDLRYEATKATPEYFYLGVDLLGSMARANEYGLKHREDSKLRDVLRRYDFNIYATNPAMIRAWAAQLANQVYWLRQLGEQDVVDNFIEAFRKTYPDSKDGELTDQQFMNKIYGMTHIIFAAAEYYQHPVKESDFQWIYDYYRKNINMILTRAKEDVVAEVGINFLLAGLEHDPVVGMARKDIQQAMDRKAGLVPSTTGSTDLLDGEHRNVLAVMLLDWRGAKEGPTIQQDPEIFDNLPYGLVSQ